MLFFNTIFLNVTTAAFFSFRRLGTLSTRISRSVPITVPIVVAALRKQRDTFDQHVYVLLLIITLSTPSSMRWTVEGFGDER